MTDTVAYLVAIGVTFVINVPFGFWRAGVRKFSPQWFLAVHAAVPMVIALRFALGLPFRWKYVAVLRRRLLRRPVRRQPAASVARGSAQPAVIGEFGDHLLDFCVVEQLRHESRGQHREVFARKILDLDGHRMGAGQRAADRHDPVIAEQARTPVLQTADR